MSELVSGSIPSLLNGISQQTPNLRMPSQADLQENGFSSPVDGLVKRPPLTHIAKLLSTAPDVPPHVQTINRDTEEQYVAIATDGDLKVFDIRTGAEQVVNFPNGKNYLYAANPREDFSMMPIEDYTFVLNRSVLPRMAIPPTRMTEKLTAKIKFKLKDDDGEKTPVPVVTPPPPLAQETWALVYAPPTAGYNWRPLQLVENYTAVPGIWFNSLTPQEMRNQVENYWAGSNSKPFEGDGLGNTLVAMEYRFNQSYKFTTSNSSEVPNGYALTDIASLYVVPIVAHFSDGSTRSHRMLVRVAIDTAAYSSAGTYKNNVAVPTTNTAYGAENAFKGGNPYRVSRKLSTESPSVLGAVAGEYPMLIGSYPIQNPANALPSGPAVIEMGTINPDLLDPPQQLPYPWTGFPNWAGLANYTKTW